MISVILPTLDRSERLIKCLESLNRNSTGEIETVLIIDESDYKTRDAVIAFAKTPSFAKPITLRVMAGHPTAMEKWNHGAAYAAHEWLMLAADDIFFTPEWDKKSLETLNNGFLALRDNPMSIKEFEPHYMATKTWLRNHNGRVLACPHYKQWGPDVEIADRAKLIGDYKVSEAVIPHFHVYFHTAFNDATYERGRVHWESDLRLLQKRKAAGYPNDFEGCL